MRFLGIQNSEVEGFGRYAELLPALGVAFETFPAFAGGPPPPAAAYDAILVGGTPAAAYALEEYAFLVAEEEYVRSALTAGKPCLGICFGAQLLARILGAGVRRAGRSEIGVCELELTPAGRADPLLAGFPARFPVFQWHGDTFDLPAGADLLASGEECKNQMFRRGDAVGVQFHLETTASEAASWVVAYAEELRRSGRRARDLLGELRRHEQAIAGLAGAFLTNFVRRVRAR